MTLSLPDPVLSYLKALSNKKDDEIDIAETALVLAQIQQPDISLERYKHHLKLISEQTHENFSENEDETVQTQLNTIRTVLSDMQGYQGDTETYDDLQNANLIRVIERRKGMPITLCILSIYIGRAQGWQIHGLNIPGHVLCRIDFNGERLIFDPFHDWKPHDAASIRALVKQTAGQHTELSADYFEPDSNRELLIRLQNNIKFRQIENEEYEDALKTVEAMLLIDPDEYRLWLEIGVLHAKVGQTLAAIKSLEHYLTMAPDDRGRYEASMLLKDLKISLN